MTLTLPLRLVSVLNSREHWGKRAARAKIQRNIVKISLRRKVGPLILPGFLDDAEVLFTRVAPRQLDGDNLQAAFKAVRDGVADALGVKDNDPRIAWRYAQERGKPREYAVRVEIT